MNAEKKELKNYVYMDNAATTKPYPEIVEYMSFVQENFYWNPSALYGFGVQSERLIRRARNSVASLIGAHEDEIYFTSGGTESNNWALIGSIRAFDGKRKHIITSSVEHPSVTATTEYLKQAGFEITVVPVDRQGFVDPQQVLDEIRSDTCLISIISVQNEVGTIEPCQEIGLCLSQMGPKAPIFHIDAVQGLGHVHIDVNKWGVDLMTLSSHKIHGPKGVGALFIRKETPIKPLIFGGDQEKGLRAGTENLAGICGFRMACDMCKNDMDETRDKLVNFKTKLVAGITEAFPDAVLNGPDIHLSAPHIVNFSFPGFRGETILYGLEERGVLVSTGSSCSSRKREPSPILLAMGKTQEEAWSAIRFSMSRFTTEKDVEATVLAVEDCLKKLEPWRKKMI